MPEEDVNILDGSGNKVSGVLSIPEKASSVVVLSHGLGSCKSSRIYRELQDELNNEGIGTLRYDYYGHGPAYGHEGPEYGVSDDITISKACESLKAMVGFVRERADYKVGLFGNSCGGLISLIVASQDQDISALALKSPVTEPIRFWRDRIRAAIGDDWLKQWETQGKIHYKLGAEDYDLKWGFWEDLQKYDTLANAKNISCPTLIMHGDSDRIVPISQSNELARVLNTEIRVFEGADHAYSGPGQYEDVKKTIKEFLIDNI